MGVARSLVSQNIRKFKTTVETGLVTTGAGGTFSTSYGGNITEIDDTAGNNYGGIGMQSALRSLYEEYRIDAIKFTFVPIYTQTIAGPGNGGSGGQVAYAVNRAPGAAVPLSMIDILRQNDCKVFNAIRGFAVTVRRPQWAGTDPLNAAVIVPGVGTPYIASAVVATKHAWCSTRSLNLAPAYAQQPTWWGMDFCIEGVPGAQQVYKLYKTYYITFRNQN